MTHVVPASFALGIALCLAMCFLTLGAHFLSVRRSGHAPSLDLM
jgi:hypothetical protein